MRGMRSGMGVRMEGASWRGRREVLGGRGAVERGGVWRGGVRWC